MASQKSCIACSTVLPLAEFYKHAAMADGHLNKCKSCCRKHATKNRWDKIEQTREYDRGRSMLPHRVSARLAYAKTEKGKLVRKNLTLKWLENNKHKRAAHVILGNAVRDGKIIKPKSCECGKVGRIHGHHDDYSKPLEIRWLCAACHRQRHKEIDLERKNV